MHHQEIGLNDFKKQWQDIKANVLQAVEKVGDSGWLILGKETQNFENNLAQILQIPYAVGCANGLDAIEIGLRCLGLQTGDAVLTTPLSAFATTLAIMRAGGVPVFADVDESGLVNLDQCRMVLEQNPSIRFFVPVHLYGHALNLKKLAALVDDFSIKIIEDCAQAICAKSFDMPVGTIGEVAAISFYPTKNLGCMGDGGALLLKDSQLVNNARGLRDYGQTEKYHHAMYGMNSRLDELQSAILNDALLPKLVSFTQRRIDIARRYLNEIRNPNIQIPPVPLGSRSVWHLFPILIAGARSLFQAHMKAQQIITALHYPTLITAQPALTNQGPPIIKFPLVQAQRFADQIVSIPIHPYLSEQEVDRIILACNSWEG